MPTTIIWSRPSGSRDLVGPSVTVKFKDGLVVRQTLDVLTGYGSPADFGAVAAVLSRYPIVDVAPVFDRPVADLEEDRRMAAARTGVLPPDLTLYFELQLAPGAAADALVQELQQLPAVESAYVTPGLAPPP